MIEIYDWKNENYARNGDMILDPTSCVVECGLDLTFLLEMEHPYDSIGRWKYIKKENVIAVPTPWSEKQLFRIYDYKKNMDSIKVYARHIYYDLRHKTLLDVRPTDATAQEALDIIFQGTKFSAFTDMNVFSTAYYIRKKITAAINSSDENSFLNRWGGEVLPDNYTIYINEKIGEDNGVRAEFGFNLQEIEENIDSDNVITRIIPVGADGIMLEGDEPWVDSVNIDAYPNIKEEVIEYSHIKVVDTNSDEEGYETLAEAQEALRQVAKYDFEINKVDEPPVNYVVKIVELSNTTEYEKYRVLENIGLGDTILCRHRDIDIDVTARCIKIKYDCITKRNLEIELGNFIKDYFEEQDEINSELLNIKEFNNNVYTRAEANKVIENQVEESTKDYVTDGQVNEKLSDYITVDQVNKKLLSYSKTSEVDEKLSSYVKQSDYNLKIAELEEKIKQLSASGD